MGRYYGPLRRIPDLMLRILKQQSESGKPMSDSQRSRLWGTGTGRVVKIFNDLMKEKDSQAEISQRSTNSRKQGAMEQAILDKDLDEAK